MNGQKKKKKKKKISRGIRWRKKWNEKWQSNQKLGSSCDSSHMMGLLVHCWPSKQCQYLSGWTQIVLGLGGWNVGRFFSPLLFPSGGQCCDALACPCWESCSSLRAPLPCQAADQMWYLQCLPVYLPVHSHWLRRAQDSRSTEVFVAEDCAWLYASRGSPFQTPPFAGGSLSLWEWWHV